MTKTGKILIIVAHPDDEVLGCGGTIALLASNGQEVSIATFSKVITSRYQQPGKADSAVIQSLHSNAYEVAKILGAKDVFLYDLPDNRFDTIPLLDIAKTVETLIDGLQPEVIYTHHGGDLNIDHQIVNRAVLTATRPLKDCTVKEVLAFEVPSSTEWAFQQFQPFFHPNVFVDITETLETKIKALELYESEARAFPHPRSPESLRTIARRWGSMVGLEAAEAFQLIRSIR